MTAGAIVRRPGVVFETEAPALRGALPRMDVAAFVGFAATGPLDVPVAIDSIDRFRDVFGHDLELAWDPALGRKATAHLGSAVEAFFRNGGRRCWVVRVARRAEPERRPSSLPSDWVPEGAAVTSELIVPGLVAMGPTEGRPAVFPARCPGSGFDALASGGVLRIETVGNGRLASVAGGLVLSFDAPVAGELEGARLRLRVQPDLEVHVVVERQSDRRSLQLADPQWFRRDVAITTFEAECSLVRAGGDVESLGTAQVSIDPASSTVEIWSPPSTRPPQVGDVVLLDYNGPAFVAPHPDALRLVVCVQSSSIRRETAAPMPGATMVMTCEPGLWPVDASAVAPLLTGGVSGVRTERLSFDVVAWNEHEVAYELGAVGLVTRPVTAREQLPVRSAARLPSDAALFDDGEPAPHDDAAGRALFVAQVSQPRFPLAAPKLLDDERLIPLGMTDRLDRSRARSRLVHRIEAQREPLSRDGLSRFSVSYFLDPQLFDLRLPALRARIRDRIVDEVAMRGVAALVPIREVTIIAAPDGVQPGWSETELSQPPVLEAPELLGAELLASLPDDCACDSEQVLRVRIDWNAPSWSGRANLGYEIEVASDHDFGTPSRYVTDATEKQITLSASVCEAVHIRVRGNAEGFLGPWSTTIRFEPDEATFRACNLDILPAPDLGLDSSGGPTTAVLTWEVLPDADAYTLEVSSDAGMHAAERLEDEEAPTSFATIPGPGGTTWARYEVERSVGETLYYRVRLHRSSLAGPWSTTVVVPGLVVNQLVMHAPETFDGLSDADAGPRGVRGLHRGLLRLCAAREDLVAVLSLPDHYRHEHASTIQEETLTDPAGTSSVVPPLTSGPLDPTEARALTFGALYHPWVSVRERDERSSVVVARPPDGSVCGLWARLALTDGAWHAPANHPLRGLVGVRWRPDDGIVARLQSAGVNMLVIDPRGLMPWGADTLTLGAELRPIGTRRLMILLRRFLLREGHRLVFSSHTARFRRRVVFDIRDLLGRLYARGAFAGATASDAFRVVADTTNNPPGSIDLGRLIVEIRVAPSRPLEFLIVRLLERGLDGVALEEVPA